LIRPISAAWATKGSEEFSERDRKVLSQCFPSGKEFLPREEFHEFRGGIST